RLLLGDERVDLVSHLGRSGQSERLIEAVPLLVDPGAVHRDEQARVGILLGDRRDAGPVKREVRADVDLEEVDRLAVRVDAGRLPRAGPPGGVARGGEEGGGGIGPSPAPRGGQGGGEVRVVGLEDDLPAVAAVADDHAGILAAASSARWSRTASSATTS